MRVFKQLSCIASLLLFLSGCGESREELWKKAKTGDRYALKELADQGDAEAQYELGELGNWSQDFAEAVKWYRLAAEQGNANAQYGIGFLHNFGEGVPKDYVEAGKWYRLAAEQGHARAQSVLGNLYANGEGVPQDYAEAYAWSSVAAAGGYTDAVKTRALAAANLKPEYLSIAQKRAAELFEKYGSGK